MNLLALKVLSERIYLYYLHDGEGTDGSIAKAYSGCAW